MHALAAVLIAKIALTVLWSFSLMLCPASCFLWAGIPISQPMMFLRLLGMAFFALLVGYVLGLLALWQGDYPSATVTVGIVSNGGACAILCMSAIRSDWKDWGVAARVAMWISLFATGLITLGLVLTGPLGLGFSVSH